MIPGFHVLNGAEKVKNGLNGADPPSLPVNLDGGDIVISGFPGDYGALEIPAPEKDEKMGACQACFVFQVLHCLISIQ